MQCSSKQLQTGGRSVSHSLRIARPQSALLRQSFTTVAKFSSSERSAKKAQEENASNVTRAVSDGGSRRTLLAVGGVAALLTAAKLYSDSRRSPQPAKPVMQVASNFKLSDNPVANDAVKVLADSKANDLSQQVARTRTQETAAIGIQRMELPQGRSVSRNPNRLEDNESLGASTLRNASRQDSDRNPVQRFMDSTNANISENVIKGAKPPLAK